MNLNKILWQNAHWNINKEIAKKVWMNWALILAHLISFQEYFRKEWKLVKTKKWDWFFSQTENQIEDETFLSRRPQDKAIKDLESIWFIETVLAWNPAKKHFRVNSEKIMNFLMKSDENIDEENNENCQTSLAKKDKLDCTNWTTEFVQKGQTNNKEEKEIRKRNNKKVLSKDNTKVSTFEWISPLWKFNENNKTEETENSEKTKAEEPTNENSAVGEKVTYWNEDINKILLFLKQTVWIDDFKEPSRLQRMYWKHMLNLWKRIWKDEYLSRVKSILEDWFKLKNSNSIAYLYKEIKSFIHSPIVDLKPKQKVTYG